MAEKVALLDSIKPAADELFESAGLEVVRFPQSISVAGLKDLVSEVQVLGVRSGPAVPAEVIEAATALEVIGCFSVGHNHIDSREAAHRGIPVFNAVFENTRSVAEYVVIASGVLLRRLHEHDRLMHEGIWSKTDERSYELLGKTVGMIGYGATGSQAATMLELLGMSAIFYDPSPKFPNQSRAERVEEMRDLLARADIVSVHVPGGQSVIGAEELKHMKPGSYLINTSRGEAVDNEAVLEALDTGHLAGYGVDVFEGEPKNRGDVFQSRLRGHRKVFMTPHIAGSSQEAQLRASVATPKRILGYLATGTTMGAVNVGEVMLGPMHPGMTRVAQFHHNTPGAAQAVDGVFADYGLNINRQRLETKNGVGYVVSDVAPTVTPDAVDAIRGLEYTIRVRTITGL